MTYTATDDASNTATASLMVTVEEQDTTPVIINITSNIISSTTLGRDTTSVTSDIPSTSDNSNSHQLIGNYTPTVFEVRATDVAYTATDDAINTATVSLMVTVEESSTRLPNETLHKIDDLFEKIIQIAEELNIGEEHLFYENNGIGIVTKTNDKYIENVTIPQQTHISLLLPEEYKGTFTVIVFCHNASESLTNQSASDVEILQLASVIVTIKVFTESSEEIKHLNSEINFISVKEYDMPHDQVRVPGCFFFIEDEDTNWNSTGCTTHPNKQRSNEVTCKCTHLTSFAVLLETHEDNGQREEDSKILGNVTYIGLSISTIFLIITLFLISVFRDLRNSPRFQILRHLIVTLLFVNISFASMSFVPKRVSIACNVVAGCLHYSLLAALSWMTILSTDMYMKIKYAFADHEKRLHYSRYVGWILPLIAVVLTAAVTRERYVSNRCWLNVEYGTIWTFIIPVMLTSTVVSIQLAVVGVYAYLKSRIPNQTIDDKNKLKKMMTLIRRILLLAPVVGVTWLFGVLIVFDNSILLKYIFVILNSMQGFFVWLSQCFFSDEVRNVLKKQFSRQVSSGEVRSEEEEIVPNAGGQVDAQGSQLCTDTEV